MINQLSKSIAIFFARKGMIKEKNIDIYAYGYEILIADSISWLVTLILAIVTKTFIQSAVYMLVFEVMREAAGGYHATSHLNCFMISTVVYLAFVGIILFLPDMWYTTVITASLLINALLIWRYAPVDSESKRLSMDQKIRFRKRSLVLNCIFTAAALGCIAANFDYTKQIGLCIALGLVSVGFSLLASIVRDEYRINRERS